MGFFKRSKRSKHLSGASGSTSEPSPSVPPGGPASGQPNPELRLEQPLEEHKPQQAAPISRTRHFFAKFKLTSSSRPSSLPPAPSPSPSPSPGIEHQNNTTDQPIATSALSAPVNVPARPHTSYSGSPPHSLSARGNVAAVSSGSHGSHSSSDLQGSSSVSASAQIGQISHLQSEPTASENLAPPSTPNIPAPTCQVPPTKSTSNLDDVQPSSYSSMVWAKALEIATKKLSENNLPPLSHADLTSQSAAENIGCVIDVLKTLNRDDEKKGWHYTWRGKEIRVVKRLGKILKGVDKYAGVVGTAIQSNPQVGALVWAGILVIMRVRIECTFLGCRLY